jgi:hypothetical protein
MDRIIDKEIDMASVYRVQRILKISRVNEMEDCTKKKNSSKQLIIETGEQFKEELVMNSENDERNDNFVASCLNFDSVSVDEFIKKSKVIGNMREIVRLSLDNVQNAQKVYKNVNDAL